MRSAILFLKAAIPGGASGDLFAAPAQVAGHMRGSAYVAPYTAQRRRKAPGLDYPDEAHARLHRLGLARRAGQPIDPAEVDSLFHHFRGYVEDDRGGGRPFHAPEHIHDLADDYTDEIAEGSGTGSIVDPDEAGEYWRRAARAKGAS